MDKLAFSDRLRIPIENRGKRSSVMDRSFSRVYFDSTCYNASGRLKALKVSRVRPIKILANSIARFLDAKISSYVTCHSIAAVEHAKGVSSRFKRVIKASSCNNPLLLLTSFFSRRIINKAETEGSEEGKKPKCRHERRKRRVGGFPSL